MQRLNEILRLVPTWTVYPLGLMPAVGLWYLAMTGGLGIEPIRALEKELGLYGLQFLLASLFISPARRFLGLNLVRYRRAVSLVAFFYVVQHLGVWLVLDVGIPSQIWADIVKRPYVTVGMAGFLAMLPLALTSNDWSIRRMGAERWRSLHRLAYVAVAAGALHYILLVRGWPREPFVYAAIAAAALALRFWPARRRAPA